MAKRIEIANDIKKDFGSCLSISDVGRYLGFCYRKTRNFLSDLPYYDTGKEKKYLAIDIARKLDNMRVGES